VAGTTKIQQRDVGERRESRSFLVWREREREMVSCFIDGRFAVKGEGDNNGAREVTTREMYNEKYEKKRKRNEAEVLIFLESHA